MALLEVKTSYATYTDCTLRVGQYQMDGSIAVEIFSRREGPVARITVCLCDSALAENEAYVDTNNCPWVVDFLEAKGRQNRLEERDVVDIVFIQQWNLIEKR